MKNGLSLLLLVLAITIYIATPVPLDPVCRVLAGSLLGIVCFVLGFVGGRRHSLGMPGTAHPSLRPPTFQLLFAFFFALAAVASVVVWFIAEETENATAVYVVVDRTIQPDEGLSAKSRKAILSLGCSPTLHVPVPLAHQR